MIVVLSWLVCPTNCPMVSPSFGGRLTISTFSFDIPNDSCIILASLDLVDALALVCFRLGRTDRHLQFTTNSHTVLCGGGKKILQWNEAVLDDLNTMLKSASLDNSSLDSSCLDLENNRLLRPFNHSVRSRKCSLDCSCFLVSTFAHERNLVFSLLLLLLTHKF